MTDRSSESWRDMPGFPGYRVSDLGRATGPSGRLLRAFRVTKGYVAFGFYREGQKKTVKAHRAVLLAFVGPRPVGMEIRHLDGNPKNNALENLKYGTSSENKIDSVAHGTHARHRARLERAE